MPRRIASSCATRDAARTPRMRSATQLSVPDANSPATSLEGPAPRTQLPYEHIQGSFCRQASAQQVYLTGKLNNHKISSAPLSRTITQFRREVFLR